MDGRHCNGALILEACASNEIHSAVSDNPNRSLAHLFIINLPCTHRKCYDLPERGLYS